jgi:hypothetical protein
MTAVVAVGQFLQRSALRVASGGLFLLLGCQGRGSSHMLPWALARLLRYPAERVLVGSIGRQIILSRCYPMLPENGVACS